MSLPTITFLKEQAARLSAYMGDKHRFRLRASSAMEAVAAMYRQPDWNTLQALSERGCATPLAVSSPVVSAAQFPRPLFWLTDDQPGELLSEADWFRHAVVVGGSQGQRESWLQQHFAHQSSSGGAGVFLNVAGSALSPAERERCAAGMLVNLCDGTGAALNLFSGLDADEAASLICDVSGLRDYSIQGTDHWMQYAHYVLTVVIGALQAAKQRVSLSSLVTIFRGNLKVALEGLAIQLPGDGAAKKALDAFLDSCRDTPTWHSVIAIVAPAIERLNGHRWAHQLFSNDVGAQGLYEQLCSGKCLLIETPDAEGGRPALAVLHGLRHAIAMRHTAGCRDRQQDWVFGLGEVQAYCRPIVERLSQQGRSARVALLFTYAEEPPRPNSAPPYKVGYARNQLYLDGRSRSELQALVETMTHRPVLVQPGRLTALD